MLKVNEQIWWGAREDVRNEINARSQVGDVGRVCTGDQEVEVKVIEIGGPVANRATGYSARKLLLLVVRILD